MATTFYSTIKNYIGVDKLFCMDDISHLRSLSVDALKEEMSRLTKKKQVQRVAYGIYLIPSGKLTPEALNHEFIRFRFLSHGDEVFGFFGGDGFPRSLLGLWPEKNLELYSNKITSGKKVIYANSQRITLHKPYVKVTKNNVQLTSFLTYLTNASEDSLSRYDSVLSNYVREEHLNALEASAILPKFPAKTALRLLSAGFYKLMWRH